MKKAEQPTAPKRRGRPIGSGSGPNTPKHYVRKVIPSSGKERPAKAMIVPASLTQKSTTKHLTLIQAKKRVLLAKRWGVTTARIKTMEPLEIILLAARIEAAIGNFPAAAAIAEKGAPYVHVKREAIDITNRNSDTGRDDLDIQAELRNLAELAHASASAGALAEGMPTIDGFVVNDGASTAELVAGEASRLDDPVS